LFFKKKNQKDKKISWIWFYNILKSWRCRWCQKKIKFNCMISFIFILFIYLLLPN